MLNQSTKHAETRKQQRGISDIDINIAFQYGEMKWSHGCILFVITDRALKATPNAKNISHLRGLTLVTAQDGSLVTVKFDYNIREHPVMWRKKDHLN